MPTGGVDKGGLHAVLRYMNEHSEVIYCATMDPDGDAIAHKGYGVCNERKKDG